MLLAGEEGEVQDGTGKLLSKEKVVSAGLNLQPDSMESPGA